MPLIHHACCPSRKRHRDRRTERKMPCEDRHSEGRRSHDGGRDYSDVAATQELLATPRSWREDAALPTPLASRTMRD